MNDIDMPATKRAATAYLTIGVLLTLIFFWAGTWVVFGDPPSWLLRLTAFWLLGMYFNRSVRLLITSADVLGAMRAVERAQREALRAFGPEWRSTGQSFGAEIENGIRKSGIEDFIKRTLKGLR